MIEVEVFNFQSVQHAKVGIDGFTVVLGPSDIGKSALVRAIKFALTNAPGTSFVRHGDKCDRVVKGNKKCKCSSKVILRMPDQEVIWEKGDSINSYTVTDVNGTQVYEGLDRGTPSFLSGFQKVKIGTSTDLIQIPKQFEPIFLLNESGSTVADVLSDLASLGRLNEAADCTSKDRREAVSKRKLREEDLTKARRDLAQFEGLDDIAIEGVQASLSAIERGSKLLSQVTQYTTRILRIQEECQELTTLLECEVPTIPVMVQTLSLLQTAVTCIARQSRIAVEVDHLERVAPRILPVTDTLRENQQQFTHISSLHRTLVETVPTYKSLNVVATVEVPLPKSVAELYKSAVQVDALEQSYGKLTAWWDKARSLECEVIPEASGLQYDQLNEVVLYSTRFQALSDSLTTVEETLTVVTEELDKVVEELQDFGVCPVCSQPIGDSHTLHLGAL